MKHDLQSADDLDPIEAAFFRSEYAEPDWEPAPALPREARLAMHATVGMLALAILALSAFVIHARWVMPAPEPIGSYPLPQPLPQPTAARWTSPSAG